MRRTDLPVTVRRQRWNSDRIEHRCNKFSAEELTTRFHSGQATPPSLPAFNVPVMFFGCSRLLHGLSRGASSHTSDVHIDHPIC
jgi:hypothetical protein